MAPLFPPQGLQGPGFAGASQTLPGLLQKLSARGGLQKPAAPPTLGATKPGPAFSDPYEATKQARLGGGKPARPAARPRAAVPPRPSPLQAPVVPPLNPRDPGGFTGQRPGGLQDDMLTNFQDPTLGGYGNWGG